MTLNAFHIRKVKTTSGSDRFEVSGYTSKGKQVRRRFKTLELAQGCKHTLELQESRNTHSLYTIQTHLSPESIKRIEALVDSLPEGVTIENAIKSFLKKFNRGTIEKPIQDAIFEFIEEKEATNPRPSTIQEYKARLSKFSRWAGDTMLQELDDSAIRSYLVQYAPQTFNNERNKLNSFLKWAVIKEYLSYNPIEKIERAKVDTLNEVEIMSVPIAKKFLQSAYKYENVELLAFCSIAIFAGLRPNAELPYLTWDNIDLDSNEIHIKRSKKRSHHRYVPIHPTLRAWLELCVGKDIYPVKAFRRKLAHIKQTTGFKGGVHHIKGEDQGLAKWTTDLTRHTFGSYRLADIKNEEQIAAEMGNSPSMVKRHYKKAVTQRACDAFWNLTPEKALNQKAPTILEAIS